MAINWTPARLEVDLNYKSKDIILASEWNNLWKETRLQGNNNTDGIVLLIETVEGNVTHLTNLDNLFADLESKVTAHTGNTDIHVTSEQKTAWTVKYDKPSGGIPKSDLASAVQSSLDKADTALQQHQDISALTNHVANNNVHVTTTQKAAWSAKYDKAADGIPKTDLASGVQTSLNKADTALQEHQDISDLVSHTQNSNIHVTSEQKTAWSAKYDKPAEGIPKTDLSSDIQTSLTKADASAEVFLVTFNPNPTDFSNWTADKTYAEITAAHDAGKIERCSIAGVLFGQSVGFANSTAFFMAEDYISAFSPKVSTALFTINSADEVTFQLLYHYSSEFSQKTIKSINWSNGVYSFESSFPKEIFDIEIELDSTATESQLDAWSNAKLTAVFGTNTMKALGVVPTVDIPVIVKKVMK